MAGRIAFKAFFFSVLCDFFFLNKNATYFFLIETCDLWNHKCPEKNQAVMQSCRLQGKIRACNMMQPASVSPSEKNQFKKMDLRGTEPRRQNPCTLDWANPEPIPQWQPWDHRSMLPPTPPTPLKYLSTIKKGGKKSNTSGNDCNVFTSPTQTRFPFHDQKLSRSDTQYHLLTILKGGGVMRSQWRQPKQVFHENKRLRWREVRVS